MEKKKLWFKAKRYGWGWYPVTLEGYIVTIVYIAAIIKVALCALTITEYGTNTASEFLWNYLPTVFLLSFLMIWICYKTGEKPGWHWKGKRKF